MTSKTLLKLGRKDDLSSKLRELKKFLENPETEDEKMTQPTYRNIKGNISLISKHQEKYQLKKIEDLSIPDLERLITIITIISHLKRGDNLIKKEIEHLLDEKFQKICGASLLIKLEYENIYWFDPYRFPSCDYEVLYHYVIAKEKLGKLDELKKDKKLTFILRKTYDLGKSNWLNEKYLRPTLNRWVHFVSAVNKLGLLDEKEKKAILKHNAELKINNKFPVLAQLWNKIWLFRELGIRNIGKLQNICSAREFLEAKRNICNFIPETLNFEKEDLFDEGADLLQNKYIAIKNFCRPS
jgi:hypothetical protein